MYLQHILTGIPKSKYDNIKTKMKLDGLTCNDPSKISKFDDSFYKSEVITGLSVNKDGECSKPERMLSQEDEDEIYYMIKNLIEECINNTSDANFDIRPIKDDKVDGCAFCDYKDICFKKPSDIKYINNYDNEEGDTNE
jgi:ATP-dependent helicase/DNAse subunit B